MPPDRIAELLAELDQQTTIRAQADQARQRASRRCREIVVQLLRARAVPRKDLVARPFSQAAITIIATEAGALRRQLRQERSTDRIGHTGARGD
jgi:hypothetical protein